jgi:hypothetical protein
MVDFRQGMQINGGHNVAKGESVMAQALYTKLCTRRKKMQGI